MIILYFGGYQSFLLRSSWTWVFKSAEQPNPSTRWKGELHCRRGRLLRTQPWLEPQCQPVEEEMIVKLYKNAMQFKEMQFNAMQYNLMQCNAMPSLERYLCTNLGQKKQVLLLQKKNLRGWLQIFYSPTDASTNQDHQDVSTYGPYNNNNQPHLEKINKPHISPPPARWVPQPGQIKKSINAWSKVLLYEYILLASPSAQSIKGFFRGNWLFWGTVDTLFFQENAWSVSHAAKASSSSCCTADGETSRPGFVCLMIIWVVVKWSSSSSLYWQQHQHHHHCRQHHPSFSSPVAASLFFLPLVLQVKQALAGTSTSRRRTSRRETERRRAGI